MFDEILVCLDGSPLAEKILPLATWFDYTHHDPEFIEGQSFAWIPAKSMRE